jgi:SAM-dependent methyltransferase
VTDPAALRELWRRIPVDDIGYFTAEELLAYDDDALRRLVDQMTRNRYGGWRNYQDRTRNVLGLDTTVRKRVLDYGCGIGLDALQYAQAENAVVVADLYAETVALARRVLSLYECSALTGRLIGPDGDLVGTGRPDGFFDVVHMSGVLHHIPDPQPILAHCRRWLKPHGELRLLLYSDQAWRQVTGTDPPEEVTGHPAADRYASHMDMAGSYADWYDPARLAHRTGSLFKITRCEYVGADGTLLAAVLMPKAKEKR